MNKLFLLGVIVAVPLVSLACRSGSNAPAVLDESPTTTHESVGAGANWVGTEPGSDAADKWSVTSKYETLDGRRALRLKLDWVTVSLNIEDVTAYLEKHFAENPHLAEEKALAEKLRRGEKARSEYRYEHLPPAEQDRPHYCVAPLPEEGSFLITLHDTGGRVPRIVVCKYSHVYDPQAGYAGRRFRLKDDGECFVDPDRIHQYPER